MSKKKKISVVIPCYNEEKVIVNTINNLRKYFFKYRNKYDYELIFVNDGSKDKTEYYLKKECYQRKKEKFISYFKNRGKGYAVRKGLLNTNYKNILILDADLSVRIENLSKLNIFNIKEPILCISKRKQVEKQPLYRILAGVGFRWIVMVLFLMPYSDTQCPFKLLHNLPRSFFNNLKIDGFSYDVELIHKANQKKFSIYEYDVDYYNNEDSSVTLKKTIKMFFELFKIRFNL